MATSAESAFEALMKEIKASAQRIPEANLHETGRAAALRDLAAAWRHLRGGAQPGGTVVEK